MKLDLHIHTIYSDGALTVEENVRRAKNALLDGIAITDHDNIDSWLEIDSNSYDIEVIKGVELSTYHKGDSVHVLGYYLNNGGDYSELEKILREISKARMIRLKKIIKLLEKFNIYVTKEDILKEADGVVARPHIAQAIMKKYPERGYTKDCLFRDYLGNDAPCYVAINNFSTKEGVELLKRNNCLVVIAHPLYINRFNYQELLDLGIEGLEAFYKYNADVKNDALNFALENSLIVTGGSDYHGTVTGNMIGDAYLEGEYAEKFLKKIKRWII